MIDVSCAIIERNNCVLITQRGDNMDLSNLWEFPGGKVEEGESPTLCIIREIQEELNLNIEVLQELTPSVHSYIEKIIRLIPFVCEIQS